MSPSTTDYLYTLYPTTNDPRVFRTGMTDVRTDPQFDIIPTSDSRFPASSVHRSSQTNLEVSAPVDLGDMIFALAGLFDYQRSAAGVWNFLPVNGDRRTGFSAPQNYERLLMHNVPDNGPNYEVLTPVPSELELLISRSEQATMTQRWIGKAAESQTRPATAPAPDIVQVNTVRGDYWRVRLAAGHYSDLAFNPAVLSCRITVGVNAQPVYNFSETGKGWGRTVFKKVEPQIIIGFETDDDWLSYYEAIDEGIYFELSAPNFRWLQFLRRSSDGHDGFTMEEDLLMTSLAFVPVAGPPTGMLAANTITVNSADQTVGGDTLAGAALNWSGSADFGQLPKTGTPPVGFIPEQLNLLARNETTDEWWVGGDNWPRDVGLESITIGSDTYTLAYDAADALWKGTSPNAHAIDTPGTDVAVQLNYGWAPDVFADITIENTGVSSF